MTAAIKRFAKTTVRRLVTGATVASADPGPPTTDTSAFCACGHRFGLHAALGPHACLGPTGAGGCSNACSGFLASAMERRR